MIKFYFDSCDYAEDFEALVDAHEFFNWVPELEYDVWFKAYDTSCHENEREIELDGKGYKFDCYVYLSKFGMGGKYEIFNKPAKTKEEAEEMLKDMAVGLLDNAEAIEILRQLISMQKQT